MKKLELNKIICGDCLVEMLKIPDKSVDMVLCDLPYGTTACKWDTIIPFEPLWKEYKRIIKNNGAIVLTASQPFTSALVMSNPDMFKYEWIWDKKQGSSPLNAKFQPNKIHENILVFSKSPSTFSNKGVMKYFPQKTTGHKSYISGKSNGGEKYHGFKSKGGTINKGERFPVSIQIFTKESSSHPTQKPVALFEYLIKTYTNEGDLVLDNCAGSGTTGVACKMLGRNFILIEKEPEYVKICEERIKSISNPLF